MIPFSMTSFPFLSYSHNQT